MDTELLMEKFERMGARVKAHEEPRQTDRVSVDVRRDRKGEYFDLKVRGGAGGNRRAEPGVRLDVIDVRPGERHLLLAVSDEDRRTGLPTGTKQKFLCGHDERAWFVAAVPELRGASNVREAMEALKPAEVSRALAQARVPYADRNRRRNAAFVRQGEWFFVPEPGARVPQWLVLRDEPLVRTGGKPHRAEFAYRNGGELVHVHAATGRVMSRQQYELVLRDKPGRAAGYAPQRRNMYVLVRGRISHPDHKTLVLREWHSVLMNTEHQSVARRFVAFID